MDELKGDIAYAFQNGDVSMLQKLASLCQNFRMEVSVKIGNEHGLAQEADLVNNKVTDLQSEVEKLKSDIDAAELQQKILQKKTEDVVNYEQELKQLTQTAKSQRDNLSIELVNLQQELHKRKEEKLLRWDAIKRACHMYKENLQFYIHLEDLNGVEHIRVSFFTHNSEIKDKYYTCVSYHNDMWKVEEIHPMLKKEYLHDLKGIVDVSKTFEIYDMTAFLCYLRRIFLKYYSSKT